MNIFNEDSLNACNILGRKGIWRQVHFIKVCDVLSIQQAILSLDSFRGIYLMASFIIVTLVEKSLKIL